LQPLSSQDYDSSKSGRSEIVLEHNLLIFKIMANYADLKVVIANGKRDVMHAMFGTHFTKGANPEELSEVANRMIARCKTWAENWNEILNGIAPELDQIRTDKLEATAEKFIGYSEAQLQALVDAVKAKQAKAG
jgi:hypothetical protein